MRLSKSFLLTLSTFLAIALVTGVAVFFAKGYRLSTTTKTLAGTGILAIASVPDQASVYLDDHLTTATNSNINSLPPKQYDVRIVKEGYIPWQKTVDVKAGLVTDIKATLFPAIPSVYPMTYSGVENLLLSPDGQKLVYAVPGNDKKSGVWVWEMSERPIGFARGREPHQVALPEPGVDFSKATIKWSPNSNQIIVGLPSTSFLLDVDRLNDPPRDITAILQPTLASWEDDEKLQKDTLLLTVKDLEVKKIASSSGKIKWSPDESKLLVASVEATEKATQNLEAERGYSIYDLETGKSYKLPDAYSYQWLTDSKHLVSVKKLDGKEEGVVSAIEFDGMNEAALYAGNFKKETVYPWPDGSRLVFVTSLSIPTASKPNIFGINLK